MGTTCEPDGWVPCGAGHRRGVRRGPASELTPTYYALLHSVWEIGDGAWEIIQFHTVSGVRLEVVQELDSFRFVERRIPVRGDHGESSDPATSGFRTR